jgi:hypothetical protein
MPEYFVSEIAAQGRRQVGWRGKGGRFVHIYNAGTETVSVPTEIFNSRSLQICSKCANHLTTIMTIFLCYFLSLQVFNLTCDPIGDGVTWPVIQGCDQYTLTVSTVDPLV